MGTLEPCTESGWTRLDNWIAHHDGGRADAPNRATIGHASLHEINGRKGGCGSKPSRALLSRMLEDKTLLVLVRRNK